MRLVARLSACLSIVGLVLLLGVAAHIPARAATNPQPTLSIPLPCYDTNPCFDITNNGLGSALRGTSKNNSGLVGITKKFEGIDPGSHAGVGGVLGIDLSTLPNSSAEDFTTGVFGLSTYGEGALTVSKEKAGEVGVTFFPSASGGGWFGVFGLDASSDNGTGNVGIAGVSTTGIGAEGVATPNFAGSSPQVGVFGGVFPADGDPNNIGIQSLAYGTGVLAESLASAAPPGSVQTPALQVVCDNGTPAIIASTAYASPGTDFMSLDCAGNMILKGTLVQSATPLFETHTSDGRNLVSYSARQAQPTIEDVGEARLLSGEAYVAIDSTFASTMDHHSNYVVFVTPEGDSRGLYVASKTLTGFVVRENQGGRSNLVFDYRIVAKPYDTNALRLPTATAVMASLRSTAVFSSMHQRVAAIDALRRIGHASIIRHSFDIPTLRGLMSGMLEH